VRLARDPLSVALAVLDASVVVDWVAPGGDPASPAARALTRLADSDADLLGPRLLVEEVSNALLTGIRRRRWSGAAADTAFELFRDLPVRLIDEPRDLARAWDLSRRYDNHPVYDMLYLALAERLRTQLVTADDQLLTRLASTNLVIAPDQIG
jgi:predicted nucleic acid-binding protein